MANSSNGVHTPTIYAYYRVSTKKQEIDRQIEAVHEYCKANNLELLPENEYSDKFTGKRYDREQYQLMKSKLKKGDTLIVKEIDRLGRGWDENKDEWKQFQDNGVNVVITDLPLLSKSLMDGDEVRLESKLLTNIAFEMYCYFGQKQREKISANTKEALAIKKKQGVVLGAKVNTKKEELIVKLFLEGKPKSMIAETAQTSRAQVNRVLKRKGIE